MLTKLAAITTSRLSNAVAHRHNQIPRLKLHCFLFERGVPESP